MSELRGKTFTLARGEIRINGIPIAICTGFSYSRAYMTSEVRTTGRLHRSDAPINGISHTISIQAIKAMGKDLVTEGLMPSVAGTDAQQLQAALDFLGNVMDVYDIATGAKVYECVNPVPQSVNDNNMMGSHSTSSYSATCDIVYLEGEK